MAKRGEQINWDDGNKAGAITSTTWSTKGTADRLEKAREDLKRAGFAREAELLNHGRLNGAWYKVPDADRQKYLAARAGDSKRKRSKSGQENDSSRLKRINGKEEVAKFRGDFFFLLCFQCFLLPVHPYLFCRGTNKHVCSPKPRSGRS